MDMITEEQVREAQTVLFKWFIQQDASKPTTLLDSTINFGDVRFRLITHLSVIVEEQEVEK